MAWNPSSKGFGRFMKNAKIFVKRTLKKLKEERFCGSASLTTLSGVKGWSVKL